MITPKRRRIQSFIWDSLPYEIILEFFTYLELKDVGKCLRVSKHWNSLSSVGYLWKFLYERDVTVHHNDVECFRWLYKEVLRIRDIGPYRYKGMISNFNVFLYSPFNSFPRSFRESSVTNILYLFNCVSSFIVK